MWTKITHLPPHAHQMSTSPIPPGDLEILDSATSNHPPPLSRIRLLMENVEFFWDFRFGCLKSRPPPPNPNLTFEQFFGLQIWWPQITPYPPNLEHFLSFWFGYLKSPPPNLYNIFWTLDSVISKRPLPTLSPIYTIFLNFRFGYLKSPPQMELLIENLNIVETSLYTERLPSRSRCHSDDRRQSRILVSIFGTADNYSKLIFNLNFIMCRSKCMSCLM